MKRIPYKAKDFINSRGEFLNDKFWDCWWLDFENRKELEDLAPIIRKLVNLRKKANEK